ncbi:hypothetical protein [Pedobacter sp. GR22-10]|uniref:hypothetical protein n=1 Tax=Pedobacter sp. GR22-10 TaxID=2994472 RepID=UPI002245B36F|nr:hypothetical protein [Pedobacter sp. GR22-10]MCX2431732.1 hypothetical protein [Pedobacter sp. GR22-10]
MKTSNKLLIALAALLIIVPILVIATYVKVNYITINEAVKNNEGLTHFNTKTPAFVSHKIDQAFNLININGSEKAILNLTLVENPAYGYKISEDNDQHYQAIVDANGRLNISRKANQDDDKYVLNLVIFAPKFNQLAVADVLQLELNTKLKQLNLDLKNINSVSFDQKTKISQLNVNGDQVNDFSLSHNEVNELKLNLMDVEFRSTSSSYKSLALTLSGKSDITISGDDIDGNKYQIDRLLITDKGSSTISLDKIKVIEAMGNFSDATKINTPARYMKQFYGKQSSK